MTVRWSLHLVLGLVLVAGCARSDVGITTTLRSRLAADDLARAASIDVDVKDGVVTLRGQATSRADAEQAVATARDTDGVVRVVDEIKIIPEAVATSGEKSTPGDSFASGIDAGITAKVKAELIADPRVSARHIEVDTSKGTVTLTGTVDNRAERKRVLEIARGVDGVRHVTDRLVVGK